MLYCFVLMAKQPWILVFDMHQIVVFAKQSSAAFLWFRTAEKAELVFQNIQMVLAGKIETDSLTEHDDFGAFFTAPIANVSHAVFNDMAKQAELYKMLEGLGYAQRTNRS
jgi:hypothetical protein